MSTRINFSGSTGYLVAALIASVLFATGAAGQKTPPKAEDVVERAIYAYGSRPAMYGIQRNGVIKSNVKLTSPDGVREGVATNKFIRKPKLAEESSIAHSRVRNNAFCHRI